MSIFHVVCTRIILPDNVNPYPDPILRENTGTVDSHPPEHTKSPIADTKTANTSMATMMVHRVITKIAGRIALQKSVEKLDQSKHHEKR